MRAYVDEPVVLVERSAELAVIPRRRSLVPKRAADIAVSVLLLVILAPVFLLIAPLVRVFLGPGSPIVVQERVGRDGEPFRCYKFRTMLRDRRVADRPYSGLDRRRHHKSPADPRHRPFGRVLRRASLDELPQLVNVLRGDMSLVGPRPEMVDVAQRTGMLGHPRELVRPGLTGPYQVSDLRWEGDLTKGLHLDAKYVAEAGFRTDVVLLLRTVAAIVRLTGR